MNYTLQALAQIEKSIASQKDTAPLGTAAMTKAATWLRSAKRLQVAVPLIMDKPDFQKTATLSEFGYGLDLPWPVTAIEYDHGGVYDVEHDFTRALSTKRIALCVGVPGSVVPALLQEDDPWGALMVWPISFFDEKKEWELSPGVALIPRGQAHQQLAFAENPYLEVAFKVEHRLRKIFKSESTISEGMEIAYQPMLQELCTRLGEEHSTKMIRECSLDAVWVALSVFGAMGCKNVVIDAQTKQLYVIESGNRFDLNPFSGQRCLDFCARPVWQQESKENFQINHT